MSLKKIAAFLCLASIVINAPACFADENSAVGFDFEVSQASKYVWRGLVCNDDPVVQPSLTINHESGAYFNLWGSYDQTDFGGAKGRFSEMDYTLGYWWESGGREWDLNYAFYTYPNTAFDSTSEVSICCGFGGFCEPSLSISWDVDKAQSLYLSLGWAKSLQLGTQQLDLSGGLGVASKNHSSYYYGIPASGLTDMSVSLEIPIESGAGWSIVPSVAYSRVLSRSLRDVVESPDNYIFGVKAGRTF